MKLSLQLSAAGLTALLLSSCGNSGSSLASHPSGSGPFDSRGNYIEEWADNPSKWKRSGPTRPGDSLIVSNDAPPMDSVPIPTAENTPQPGNIGVVPVVARNTPPVRTTSTTVSAPSASAAARSTTTASTARKTTTATAAKPKPKPVAAKPKPKKPATVRYTVRKGDSLSVIAARNGTSVSALQRANNIKGSLIRPGQALVIPK